MRQLTSLDAQFLALETRSQTGHVGSVAILDPSTTATGTLTLADIEALITDRLPSLPPLPNARREARHPRVGGSGAGDGVSNHARGPIHIRHTYQLGRVNGTTTPSTTLGQPGSSCWRRPTSFARDRARSG